jgi:hypothetical protein
LKSNSYYPEFGWGGILVRGVTAEISGERAWAKDYGFFMRHALSFSLAILKAE